MRQHRRVDVTDFTLRDYLALERTIMSNERTLLAYGRTGLTLCVTGLTGFFYFERAAGHVTSAVVAAAGAAIILSGVLRFRSIKRRLDSAAPDETADSTAKHVSNSEPTS